MKSILSLGLLLMSLIILPGCTSDHERKNMYSCLNNVDNSLGCDIPNETTIVKDYVVSVVDEIDSSINIEEYDIRGLTYCNPKQEDCSIDVWYNLDSDNYLDGFQHLEDIQKIYKIIRDDLTSESFRNEVNLSFGIWMDESTYEYKFLFLSDERKGEEKLEIEINAPFHTTQNIIDSVFTRLDDLHTFSTNYVVSVRIITDGYILDLNIEKGSNVITYAVHNMISSLDRVQVEESIEEQLNSETDYIVQKEN